MASTSHFLSVILLSLGRLSALSLYRHQVFVSSTLIQLLIRECKLYTQPFYWCIQTTAWSKQGIAFCLGKLSLLLPHCHVYLLLHQNILSISLALFFFLLLAHLHLGNQNSKAHNLQWHCLLNDSDVTSFHGFSCHVHYVIINQQHLSSCYSAW